MAQEAETQTKWAGPWAGVFLQRGQAPNDGGFANTTGEMAGGAERLGYEASWGHKSKFLGS